MAEEKANSLNDGHQGKDHAHSAGGGIAFQHPYEEGIGHVIKGRHQHTDDAGRRQPENQGVDWSFGHQTKFLFLFIFHNYTLSFINCLMYAIFHFYYKQQTASCK